METSANLKHLAILLILLIPTYAQDPGASTTLSAPTLIFPAEDIQATVGDDVEINCGIKGKHRRCLWQDNNGQDIQLDDITDGLYIGQYSRPSNTAYNQCGIVIINVTMIDAGIWDCKVMIRGKALIGNVTINVLEEDYYHDNATAPEINSTGLRDGKSFNGSDILVLPPLSYDGGNGSYPRKTEYITATTDVTKDNSGTYTSDDSADVTTDSPLDGGPGLGRSGDKSHQGTEHPPSPPLPPPPPPSVHHHTTPSTPKVTEEMATTVPTNKSNKGGNASIWKIGFVIAICVF